MNKITREELLQAFKDGKIIQYNDAWKGWVTATKYSIETAALEDLRIVM